MSIQAGKLRHRIAIERETTTRDEYGSEVKSWTPLATVWASVDPMSPTAMTGVKESVLAGAETSQDMVRVILRPRDVTAQDRFTFRGNTYMIKAARVDNTNATMTLFAVLGVINET